MVVVVSLMLHLLFQVVADRESLSLVTQARGRNQPAELGTELWQFLSQAKLQDRFQTQDRL
jgi:hypothetical protein